MGAYIFYREKYRAEFLVSKIKDQPTWLFRVEEKTQEKPRVFAGIHVAACKGDFPNQFHHELIEVAMSSLIRKGVPYGVAMYFKEEVKVALLEVLGVDIADQKSPG